MNYGLRKSLAKVIGKWLVQAKHVDECPSGFHYPALAEDMAEAAAAVFDANIAGQRIVESEWKKLLKTAVNEAAKQEKKP